MKFLLSLAAVAAFVSATGPGYVSLPIKRIKVPQNETVKPLTKRASFVEPENLINVVNQYITHLDIGTPPQHVVVSIDTGSSDLWVYQSGTEYKYDPLSSVTSEFAAPGFSISYLDGSKAAGDYYTDDIKWGSAEVNAQFAVNRRNTGHPKYGIFGIGRRELEVTDRYDNFPYALKKAGLISSVSYSLYLDSVESDNGSLLFGALDTSRFVGPLSVVPITSNKYLSARVGVLNWEFNAVLDSGTTLTYLPTVVADEIADYLGATYDEERRYYRAPEVLPDRNLTYTIGNTKIEIPKSELWINNLGGSSYWLSITRTTSSSNFILLGDSFLRSAYVVYDLENLTIGIAQANWNPGPPNYKIIGSDGIKV